MSLNIYRNIRMFLKDDSKLKVIIRQHTSVIKERKSAEQEFRVLDILPKKKDASSTKTSTIKKTPVLPPRELRMPVDQDWPSVWPGPRTFHPASVPLPLRQGYTEKNAPPPGKYGNAELMKIPNFLHLTPPAIERHCNALKKFCTPWPEELKTEEDMQRHFPISVIDTDYCHSSPTVRDPLARIITLKIKLSNLDLDEHARDKILRLVGERYDPETDVITITTDSCPLKKQNYDYAQYILTALYYEAWRVEEWESEKSEADMEKFIWSERPSRQNLENTLAYSGKSLSDQPDEVNQVATSVERIFNEGESDDSLNQYKTAVVRLLCPNA